jgi:alkyl sulfatase BDS1-like metallo-beta-lactamase superfamily hydrolase
VIWSAPNCGNPQKVQRYPVDWADALEEMAALGAEWLFPGHGLVVRGEDAVRRVLEETARWLRGLAEQVLTRMNAGEAPEAIVQAVKPDPELSSRPYLRASYDHPQFVVRNLLRLWGGWWDGIPSHLLPASAAAQAHEIAELAGGVDALVERGRQRLAAGASALAAHLADWAFAADPEHAGAQALRRDVYAARLAEEPSLMAKGIYRAACNEARAALGEPPLPAQTRLSLGGEAEGENRERPSG